MAGGERTIKIKFTGDTTGLDRAAAQGTKSLNSWGTAFSSFSASILSVELGKKILEFGEDSVKAFSEAQESQDRLEDAFKRFPKLANTNIDALRALNKQLESKTRFDDDAFASGQAVLAQFGLTGQQVRQLTPLLADLAAKTGTDLTSAAETLGKAFLGQTKALKELGINYKSTKNQAKDVANITQLVRDKVGGFAEKEGKTAAGQIDILNNKFEDMKEDLGQKLLPVLQTGKDLLFEVADGASQNLDVLGPLAGAIAVVTAAQWLWNIAMTANPVGLLIVGIAALIAGIVILVRNVKVIGDVWAFIWKGMKGAAVDVFNAVAWYWNHTLGYIDFTVPSWVPGVGNQHWGIPKIPTFHEGGVVPGVGDRMILARGGEGVFTPEQMAALGGPNVAEIHIHIGDEVTRVVRTQINAQNRATRSRVLSMAGAR